MSQVGTVLPVTLSNTQLFHERMKGLDGVATLKDAGDLEIVTMDEGTDGNRAIALLTFTVDVDGVKKRAQTVTTVRLLLLAARIMHAKYGFEGVAK